MTNQRLQWWDIFWMLPTLLVAVILAGWLIERIGEIQDEFAQQQNGGAMAIENCPTCGGTHFGSYKCPFTAAPCVICGDLTILACSDCAIDTGKSVHVCNRTACRDEHESRIHMRTANKGE